MFKQKDSDQRVDKVSDLKPAIMAKTALRDKRIDAIRDFIKENEGKVLTIADLKNASGVSTAAYYILDLMKQGYVVRHHQRGQRGHHYTYSWVDNPEAPQVDNSISETTINTVRNFLMEWQDANTEDQEVDPTARALQQMGAAKFVKWLADNKVKVAEH